MKRRDWFVRGFLALSVLILTSPLDASTLTTIDVPGATSTNAPGINNRGEIVGRYTLQDGSTHGFLLAHGEYSPIDVPGAKLIAAHGINDRGEIVGELATISGCSRGFS